MFDAPDGEYFAGPSGPLIVPIADTFDRFWYVLNASFWYGLADVARASRLDWGVLDMAEECSTAFFATDPE